MRRLFEAMSDGQGENIHTCECARAHTHAHTQSLSSALPLKFMCEVGCICSHKNDTREKNTSVIMKQHCFSSRGPLTSYLYFLFLP